MPGQRHHYNQLVTTILDLKQSQGPKNSVFDLTEPELCDVLTELMSSLERPR